MLKRNQVTPKNRLFIWYVSQDFARPIIENCFTVRSGRGRDVTEPTPRREQIRVPSAATPRALLFSAPQYPGRESDDRLEEVKDSVDRDPE